MPQCPNATSELAKRAIKFDVTVLAEPPLVAGERYVIHYAAWGSWVKTSDFSMEFYPNRALKSVNVAADDKSDEIIKNVAKITTTGASFAARERQACSLP